MEKPNKGTVVLRILRQNATSKNVKTILSLRLSDSCLVVSKNDNQLHISMNRKKKKKTSQKVRKKALEEFCMWCLSTVEWIHIVHTRGVNKYSGRVKIKAECWLLGRRAGNCQ